MLLRMLCGRWEDISDNPLDLRLGTSGGGILMRVMRVHGLALFLRVARSWGVDHNFGTRPPQHLENLHTSQHARVGVP